MTKTKKPAGLFTVDGGDGTPEVGVTYLVTHSRKGTFRLCVTKVQGEWADGYITDGHASAANPDNARSEGEKVEVRASLCAFASEKKLPDNEWNGKPLPPEKWGRDHVSTLLYIETVCTDDGGKPHVDRMRSEPGRPRKGWDTVRRAFGGWDSISRYPTRLKGGVELFGHDDWDCATDFVHAGLLLWEGTSLHPVFRLTDAGWKMAASLRKQKGERRKATEYEFTAI